ncbi:hypothetical protein [Lichenihabitans psoromatis]|uniref:hypothetical protein n=1 Tax=Lichenihabitans psoromatis TaxID=2528642 RepID=UPI00103844E4|nr:hypothetical protein [Lichenihabitans psoromatis]
MLNPVRRLLSMPNPRETVTRLIDRADRANAARAWREAEADYAAALAIDAAQPAIWVQYGHVLKEQGSLAQAEDAYRSALAQEAGAAETHHHLGHLLLARHRVEDAVAAFRQACLLDPDAAQSRAMLDHLGGTVAQERCCETPLRDIDDLPPLHGRDPEVAVPVETSTDRFRLAVVPRLRRLPGPRAPAAVAFIHLQKTGGTTLYDMLQHAFPPHRVCPVHDDFLNLYTADEMAEFDYFSGHFDVASLRLIPKRPLQVISVFRNPTDRLISVYRSHRSHEVTSKAGVNPFVRLANALSAEDFFEHPAVRSAPEIFNHYLAAFGLGFRQMKQAHRVTRDDVPAVAVESAVARIRGLDAIGITEKFEATVALIYESLNLQPPKVVRPRNVTDALATKMKGAPTPRVDKTPRLLAAMADLTCFDETLYAAACEEADRRLKARRA